MNIYHPYIVVTDTEDELHLQQRESRVNIHFAVSRVIPLFIILFVWFVLQQVGSSLPMGWIYTFIIAALAIAGVLFLRPLIKEVKIIKSKELGLKQQSFFGVKEKIIKASDIKEVLVLHNAKSRSACISVELSSGKSVFLLKLPYANNADNIVLVKEHLQRLLMSKTVH